MNDMTIFNYEGNEVEILEVSGEVFFNPYHVGACLEMSESTVKDHLSRMGNKQATLLKNSTVGLTDFRKLHNTGEKFLTESGVYKLMFKSRKPEAEKFQDWVTDEVLPAIRKTGKYETPKKAKEAKTNLSSVNNAVKIIGQYMEQAKLGSDVRLLTVKGLYAQAGVVLPFDISAEKMYFDTKQIAKRLGIMSNTGNPAYTAVSQIFKKLNLSADDAKEFLEEVNQTGKWQGTIVKYAESAVDKLEAWLLEYGYPTTIEGENMNYHVVYDISAKSPRKSNLHGLHAFPVLK